MIFTSLIRHPRDLPSPTDALITICVNCTRYLGILASSWLLGQLQRLSVSVSVGRTEHVQSVTELWLTGPVYGCLYLVTIPRLQSCCQQRLWDVNGLWLTIQKGQGECQSRRSSIQLVSGCQQWWRGREDEEGYGVDCSHTDAAADCAVVLLWTVWAGDQDDVQPLCAVKRPAVGCWCLGSGGTKQPSTVFGTIYTVVFDLRTSLPYVNLDPRYLAKLASRQKVASDGLWQDNEVRLYMEGGWCSQTHLISGPEEGWHNLLQGRF